MALSFDFQNTIIDISSPQVELDVQDLVNAIRTVEATVEGIAYPHILNASGKEVLADPAGGTVRVSITADIQGDWQLRFWVGDYTATIYGGNLVGGLGDDPVAYSAGVQVLLIQSAYATLVSTGESGLTSEESTKLLSLDTSGIASVQSDVTDVLTDIAALQVDIDALIVSIEDALGLIGENVKWSGMAFDSNKNLISAVITQYTDNTLVTPRKVWQLTATYDGQSRITSYQLKEY